MSEPKKAKATLVYDEDMPNDLVRHDVDLSYLFNGEKELRSVKVVRDGVEFWLGRHPTKGLFWTTNERDPKILNTVTERPRGNIKWMQGGGNPHGKPKGTKNKISVKQACEKLGANPAEFLAALVKFDAGALREHKIKDPRNVTVAQRMKAAEILLNKLVPNLKPSDLGSDGEPQLNEEAKEVEQRNQIQVYLPGQGSVTLNATEEEIESIKNAGTPERFMKNHEHESEPYAKEDEDDVYVWTQDPGYKQEE